MQQQDVTSYRRKRKFFWRERAAKSFVICSIEHPSEASVSLNLILVLICLFIYLFICLFVYLFICLFVYLFICLFVYLFICLWLLLYLFACSCTLLQRRSFIESHRYHFPFLLISAWKRFLFVSNFRNVFCPYACQPKYCLFPCYKFTHTYVLCLFVYSCISIQEVYVGTQPLVLTDVFLISTFLSISFLLFFTQLFL